MDNNKDNNTNGMNNINQNKPAGLSLADLARPRNVNQGVTPQPTVVPQPMNMNAPVDEPVIPEGNVGGMSPTPLEQPVASEPTNTPVVPDSNVASPVVEPTTAPQVSEAPVAPEMNKTEDLGQPKEKKGITTKELAMYALMVVIVVIIIILLIKCCSDIQKKNANKQILTTTDQIRTTQRTSTTREIITETTETTTTTEVVTETTTKTTVPKVTGTPNITTTKRASGGIVTQPTAPTTAATKAPAKPATTTTTTKKSTGTTTTTTKADVYTYSVSIPVPNLQVVKLLKNGSELSGKVYIIAPDTDPIPGLGNSINVSDAMFNFAEKGYPAIRFFFEEDPSKIYTVNHKS